MCLLVDPIAGLLLGTRATALLPSTIRRPPQACKGAFFFGVTITRWQFEGFTPSCCAATPAGNDVKKKNTWHWKQQKNQMTSQNIHCLPGCIVVHLWNTKLRYMVRKKLPSNISSSAWLSVEAWPKYSTGPVGVFLPDGFPKLIWHATRKVSARL